MEILRSYSQLVEKTNKVLSYDISETPMLDKMQDRDLEYIANHSNICDDIKLIGQLSELVFQLNNYIDALINYTKIFLFMGKFDAVKEFISKLYVGHVGNANYISRAKAYNIQERLFDRFIEIVKIGNIEVQNYLPLILEAIFNEKSSVYVWHDAAMEYMQNYMREHEDELGDYIAENNHYELEYLSLILSFNTQKGISIIFNDKAHQKISEHNADYFLKTYISDTLAYFDKHLPDNGEERFHYIKVLAAIKNNVEVETRLDTIYDSEQDAEIKEFLAKRLGISENLNFGTEMHFKVLAQKKVQQVQERSLGVAFEGMSLKFKSGNEADNREKTYLIDIFKQEKNLLNLISLKSLYDVFDKTSLNMFAEKLFNKHSSAQDILASKWCVRMFSLLSCELFERTVFEFLFALYKTNRLKEAKYLTECLLYSQKENFLEMFIRLKQFSSFMDRYDEYIKIFAYVNNKNVEEIKDLTVGENLTEDQLKQEKQRLYQNFISGRKYSKEMFKKLFIYNQTFNQFAQKLVFGEYKQNKLYSVFVIANKEYVYIYGNKQDGDDVYISIVHQLDLDDRFEKVDLSLSNPLFEQFKPSAIDVNNFNRANMSVTNFYGTIVNGEEFVKELKAHSFYPNINDGEVMFTSLVSANEILNILVEIEFQKPITIISSSATLGNIRFYRLSEVMQDQQKYITNKSQSLSLGGVNERYFDYVLSLIKK